MDNHDIVKKQIYLNCMYFASFFTIVGIIILPIWLLYGVGILPISITLLTLYILIALSFLTYAIYNMAEHQQDRLPENSYVTLWGHFSCSFGTFSSFAFHYFFGLILDINIIALSIIEAIFGFLALIFVVKYTIDLIIYWRNFRECQQRDVEQNDGIV